MGVVFGVDEGLWNPVAAAVRKHLGEERVAKVGDDGADLGVRHDRTVEFPALPGVVVLEFLPALTTGAALDLFQMVAALHRRATLSQFRADAVDVVTDVYLVEHGLFVRVGGDEVLVKETERVR